MKNIFTKILITTIGFLISFLSYSQCEDFVVSKTTYHPSDALSCDGEISLQVSGGSEPYSYSWSYSGSPIIADSVITNLCNGYYYFTVNDASVCYYNDSIELDHCTGFTYNVVEWNSVSFLMQCDGSISVEGINGATPYTYDWEGASGSIPSTQNTFDISTIDSLCVGNYNLTITDSRNCELFTGFGISAINMDTCNEINAFSAIINMPEYSDSNCLGYIKIDMDNNGSPPYTFDWESQNNGPIFTQDSLISDLCSDTYFVTVTDAIGCTASRYFELLLENPCDVLTLVTCPQNPSYGLDCNGHINIYAVYNYYDIQSVPFSLESNDFQNLCPGLYNIEYTDTLGCDVQTTVILQTNQYESLYSYVITDIYNSTSITHSDSLGNAQVYAFGGEPPYTFEYSTDRTEQYIVLLYPGIYTVTVSDVNLDTFVSEFLIADSSYIYNNQSFPDSIINAYIANNPIENCTINSAEIDNIKIFNYSYNNNIVTLDWEITGNSFTETVTQSYYIILESGIYNFELGLFCLAKGDPVYLTAKDQIYINTNSQTIETKTNKLNVSAHPNPFTNNFTISTGKTSDYSVKITDINGKIIIENNFNNTDIIDIKTFSLESGFYILSVRNKDEIVNLKIVKK